MALDSTGAEYAAGLAEQIEQERKARQRKRKEATTKHEELRKELKKEVRKGKIWFIHGTESNHRIWLDEYSYFTGRVAYYFGMPYDVSFNWGVHNNDSESRRLAAVKLATSIRSWYKFHPNEPIVLVAHSHGGNVCISTANILGNPKEGSVIPINNLITISTPVRTDYQIEYDNVLTHNHIYNIHDEVQVNGGFDKSLANMPEWVKEKNVTLPINPLLYMNPNIDAQEIAKVPLKEVTINFYPPGGGGREKEYGRADRQFPSPTNNIEVDLVNKARGFMKGIDAHSAVMQNDTVWIKLVEPHLKYTIRYIESMERVK